MRNFILPLALFMFLLIPAGAEEVIKEFSGTATMTTEPFTVPDNWEIQWETKGQYLQILINTGDSVPLWITQRSKWVPVKVLPSSKKAEHTFWI